ncbi:hypothetical protein LX36DRAFT_664447 [Colletotrichum falcatum]|nr:hypothetical protein LX36DRAFT_664447 [Colletotrichum falcatum]
MPSPPAPPPPPSRSDLSATSPYPSRASHPHIGPRAVACLALSPVVRAAKRRDARCTNAPRRSGDVEPCGPRFGVGSRTEFPLVGGKVALVAQDDYYNTRFSISYKNDESHPPDQVEIGITLPNTPRPDH